MDFLSVSHSKTYDFIRLGCMSHRDYFNSFFFEFHSLNHFSYHHSVKSIFLVFKTEALPFILKSLLLVFYIKTKIWDWYENWQNLQFYVNYSFFFFSASNFVVPKRAAQKFCLTLWIIWRMRGCVNDIRVNYSLTLVDSVTSLHESDRDRDSSKSEKTDSDKQRRQNNDMQSLKLNSVM